MRTCPGGWATRTRTAGLSGFTATHEFAFGAPPYQVNEGVEGLFSNGMIFKGRLSPTLCYRQLCSRRPLPELRSHLWAWYKLRHHNDVQDWSGHGRHLTKIEDNFTMSTRADPALLPDLYDHLEADEVMVSAGAPPDPPITDGPKLHLVSSGLRF